MRHVRMAVTFLAMAALLAGCSEAAPQTQPTSDAAQAEPAANVVQTASAKVDPLPEKLPTTYLVICPKAATAALAPLVARRTEVGYAVQVVTIEEADKAHANEPSAAKRIRRAIDTVRRKVAAEAPLGFVLLVGTANPRHTGPLMLPAFATDALYQTTAFPCEKVLVGDYLYAVPRGQRLPDVAVGRLPARSLKELEVMVGKTLKADTNQGGGLWRRQIRLVLGQGFYGAAADRLLESFRATIVGSFVPNHLDLSVTYARTQSPYCWPPVDFRHHVTRLMNEGPALLAYVGHGHWQGLSSLKWRGRWYGIFESVDVANVRNPHHRTTVLSICCDSGKLDGPLPSLGERLVALPTGPAAFIGSSGISQPYGNAILAELAVDALAVHPKATVGEALLEVRRGLATHRITALRGIVDILAATQIGLRALPQQRVDQVSLYNLLGDPALPLGMVSPTATVTAPGEALPGSAITARATSDIAHGTAHWSMTILRDRMKGKVLAVRDDEPQFNDKMIRAHKAANDKVLAAGTSPVTDGQAKWQVRLPEDAPGVRVFVNVFIEGSEADTAGSATVTLQTIAPGSTAPSN